MLDKVKSLLGPIFSDLEVTFLWVATGLAVILMISAIMKYYQASDETERKAPLKWMRVIIIGYIALHLVTWFVRDYMQPKVGGSAATTSIEVNWNGHFDQLNISTKI